MNRICSWCGKILGEIPDVAEPLASHGICVECRDFLEQNKPGSVRDFLNRLSSPVLCVDFDARVVAANDAACKVLDRELCRIEGALVGNLVECKWARLPGGCGKEEHCLGCAIRRNVSRTFQTGAGIFREKAWIDEWTPGGAITIKWMRISTVKKNEIVFLRIDEVGRER